MSYTHIKCSSQGHQGFIEKRWWANAEIFLWFESPLPTDFWMTIFVAMLVCFCLYSKLWEVQKKQASVCLTSPDIWLRLALDPELMSSHDQSTSNWQGQVPPPNQHTSYILGRFLCCTASEMKRCDKIGELMEERQRKDRREQNKVWHREFHSY